MLKLLIVDDELVVRQGMRRIIDWEPLGITVVGEAETFSDAIDKIQRLRPDIVLCDIRMPGGTGLDIIHMVKPSFPETEFILLSGYSDREYMLDAIRSDVCDYLLKPASTEDIRKAVLKAGKKIMNQRNEELRRLEHHNVVSENLDVLRSHFLEGLLLGNPSQMQKAQSNMELYQINLKGPEYVVMLTRAYPGKAYALIQDFAFILGNFNLVATILPSLENSVAIILNLQPGQDCGLLLPLRQGFMQDSENVASAIMVSQSCGDLKNLYLCYQAVKKLLNKSYWFPKGCFVFAESQLSSEYSEETVSSLCDTIFEAAGSRAGSTVLIRTFEQFLKYMQETKPEPFLFFDRVNHIFSMLSYIFGISSYTYTQECSIAELKEQFIQLCQSSEQPVHKYNTGVVGKAIRYLEKHFDSAISLESVAASLYISPSYLSRIIKEKTDRKFQDWLHYFRIEKAIQLMKGTDKTTNQIAETCGYNSYKLFSEHFKRYTGMTASEYRESISIKKNRNRTF